METAVKDGEGRELWGTLRPERLSGRDGQEGLRWRKWFTMKALGEMVGEI